MARYVKNINEALEYIKTAHDETVKKLDEAIPKVRKLAAYPSFDLLRFDLKHINNNGGYDNTPYGSVGGHTKELAYKRFTDLNALLEKIKNDPEVLRIKAENAEVVAQNKKVVGKIKEIMTDIGIPDSYREVDTKSRARTTKYLTKQAGYQGDLSRNVATVDSGYAEFERAVARVSINISNWYNDVRKAIIAEEEKNNTQKKLEAARATLATYRIKYDLDFSVDSRKIVEAVRDTTVIGKMINAYDLYNRTGELSYIDQAVEQFSTDGTNGVADIITHFNTKLDSYIDFSYLLPRDILNMISEICRADSVINASN